MKKTFLLLIMAVFAGCNTFRVTQSLLFTDEDGNIIGVDYGQLKNEYTTEFVSPVNGKKIEMRSKLAVDVTLPDGTSFKGYQCMNTLRTGTMYKSSDGEWMFHANGTSCSVFLRTENGDDYMLVFNGLICQMPSRKN